MKRGVCRLVASGMLKRSAAAALWSLLVGTVFAGAPGPDKTVPSGKPAKPLRVLGKKAVMHIYYYAPKTLEITAVTSRFFKDVDACERAVVTVLNIVTPHAIEGDLVDAQCVAIDPPAETLEAEKKQSTAKVTEL